MERDACACVGLGDSCPGLRTCCGDREGVWGCAARGRSGRGHRRAGPSRGPGWLWERWCASARGGYPAARVAGPGRAERRSAAGVLLASSPFCLPPRSFRVFSSGAAARVWAAIGAPPAAGCGYCPRDLSSQSRFRICSGLRGVVRTQGEKGEACVWLLEIVVVGDDAQTF
jgi:hypothetical protein